MIRVRLIETDTGRQTQGDKITEEDCGKKVVEEQVEKEDGYRHHLLYKPQGINSESVLPRLS